MGWGSVGNAGSKFSSAGKWFKIQDDEDIMLTPVGDQMVMRWQTPYGVEPRETSSTEVKGWDARIYGQVFNHDASCVQIMQLTPATASKFGKAVEKCQQRKGDPNRGAFMFSRERGANGFIQYSVKYIGDAPSDIQTELGQIDSELFDLLDEVEDSILLEQDEGQSVKSAVQVTASKAAPTPDADVPFSEPPF